MKAHEFCLPNQDETEICLRDLKGRWIVLYFYPKDNTPGCTTQACDFSNELEEFENLDAVILGVSPDSPKKHTNFIAKKDLKITLLSDENKDVIKAYGAWGKKKMYGKEYEGVIRSTFIINPEGEIVAEWKKVKVKGHVEAVKEKLKELKRAYN
ncbi:MAG: thioredoxin-dependent thiol peroxidase [Epsilonproteobacteria bacterium]|nr:thioredoxin-dependent thiol peroxidase [Campylobacterota bacterium]